MAEGIKVGELRIDRELYQLIEEEIAPETGVEPEAFWHALGEIVPGSRTNEQDPAEEKGPTSGAD